MDPNANLERCRRLANRLIAQEENQRRSGDNHDTAGYELAELFQALDEWISRGGFLPRAWKNHEETH